MNDAFLTFLVCGTVAFLSIVICEIVRAIHTCRVRINRDAIAYEKGRNAKLSAENAMLWSQVTANASQTYVNTETIKRLMGENDMLVKENKDLKAGTPVKEPIRVKRFKH